jgi:hypothetical protein
VSFCAWGKMQLRYLNIKDDEKKNVVKVYLCVDFDFQVFLCCKGGWYGTVSSVIVIVFHTFWRDFDSVFLLEEKCSLGIWTSQMTKRRIW